MPHQCVALNCKNSEKKGFVMKHFPKDRKLSREWLVKLNRETWIPTGESVVCEIHFAPEMWKKPRPDGKLTLRSNAVPTIFPEPTPSDTVDSDDSLSDTISLTSILSEETDIDLFEYDEYVRKRPDVIENAKKRIKVWDDSDLVNKKKKVMESRPSSSRKIQEGEKMFTRNFCEKKWKTESFYNLHVKIHSRPIREKLLYCPRCNFQCSKQHQLDEHVKTHIAK